MGSRYHLGIYLGHDPGVAVVDDTGQPVFIGEESKFCGYKRPVFHINLTLEYLRELGISEFETLNWAFMERCPNDSFWEVFFRYQESIYPGISKFLHRFCSWKREQFFDHHTSHGACAFLASGFDRSIVLVVDGSGEDESLSVYLADRNDFPLLRKVMSLKTAQFSYGHVYSEVTRSVGYLQGAPDNHTGKVMGLSSYGRARYLATIRSTLRSEHAVFPQLVKPESDWHVLLANIVGHNPGSLRDGFTEEQSDLAASIQSFLEDELVGLVNRLAGMYPDYRTLCLSGGVAQNSLMTGRILAERIFSDVFSSPISSDTGLAYGAAALAAHQASENPQARGGFTWTTAYHGYKHANVSAEVDSVQANYNLPIRVEKDAFNVDYIADLIVDNKIVAVYQGAQEVGPRALGNRSILSLPTVEMRDKINNMIKFREPWRPFAPVLVEEALPELFNETRPEPFMTVIYDTPPRSQSVIPGVNHFDNTTRLQTVSETQNPRLHAIIKAVEARGYPPIILNTSYNVDGQTIVRTVWDGIVTALVSGVDALFLESDLVTSTLPERAPRGWISVLDRVLEEHLRASSKLRLVIAGQTVAGMQMTAKLAEMPSIRFRKVPIEFEAIGMDAFLASPATAGEDEFTLIYVGDEPWIETERYVVSGKCRMSFETSLFDTWPGLIDGIDAVGNKTKIYLIDSQDLFIPYDYYKSLVTHRRNAYQLAE